MLNNFQLFSEKWVKSFINKDNNKWQGSNSHSKRTQADAVKYIAKKKVARNKKRRQLKNSKRR